MNTIKIYLTTNGRVADLKKDFPLFQYQFQNKLLNIFVPTSILAPHFTSESEDGVVLADYIASTSVKIGMTYTARDGTIKVSKNYYMRYLKTLTYQNVEYALYERKMPQEFTFYEGQGENAPVLVMNVVNILQETESGNPEIIQITTSQTCSLDVMPSTDLDNDEPIEASELENITAQLNEINALLPLKQNIFDEGLLTTNKTVVGAINELSQAMVLGENYVGQLTGSSLPTDSQLSQFVQTRLDRQPKNGDVIIFVLKLEGQTDKNYKYIFSAGGWTNYEIPPIEEAGNGSLGIVQGTWAIGDTANTLVDISGGKILNIYIKDLTGTYRNIVEYANSLKTGLVEERAFVKDYAMPREFNDVDFISSSGYTDDVPTTPASGIQFSVETSAVGDYQLFQIEKENSADFELSSKNGYSNNIYVSASEDCNVTFRLTTQYRKTGQNWADLNIELSNPISFVAGEIQKITFSSPFTYLGEDVISLTNGDLLRQTLEVVTQTSTETVFDVYSNEVYPSIFNLTSQSYVLQDVSKNISTLIHLGIDGVIESNRVVFTVQNAESYLEYRTNQREFLVSALLPLVGQLDDTLPVNIEFGDKVYNIYSFMKGSSAPITIGDLKSNMVYNTNIGYTFTSKMLFLETSTYEGFVISPVSITAEQVYNIIEDSETIVTSLDSSGTKVVLQLSATQLNKLMKALVIPTNAPSDIEIVAVDDNNSQVMLSLGEGLYISDGKLQVSGGGGGGGTTNYPDLDNKPVLNSSNTTSQTPNANETITGTINLHKVSKTGALADTIQDSTHRTVTDTEKSTWNNPQFSSVQNVPQASTGVAGIIQLATDSEAETGTNQTKAVTPKQLKTAVDGLGSVFTLKGSVPNVASLPQSGNQIGDVYYVVSESVGYIWLNDGTTDRWEQLGLPIDLSSYVQFSDIINALNSTASDKPLSALQGKVLNDMITSLMTELGDTQQDVADNMTDIANLQSGKANIGADNLSSANVTDWRNKLGIINLPIGSIIQSTCKQNDSGLHLADGSELMLGGTYDAFCQYVINHQGDFPTTDLSTYNAELEENGQCGKYVVSGTYIRLPKITKMTESANNSNELGQSVKAGLPNITGKLTNMYIKSGGSQTNGALSISGYIQTVPAGASSGGYNTLDFNANNSNNIYGSSETVQPQTIKYYYYIVVGTISKTDIEINIDNVATDLNNKADKSGANIDAFTWAGLLAGETAGWLPQIKQISNVGSHSGYVQYGNVLMQWGLKGAIGGSKVSETVTLYKPYASASSYSVVSYANTGPENDYMNAQRITGVTATSFKIQSYYSETGKYAFWFAIGFAPEEA